MTENRFSYPCRFKQREDGTYFIRFPDLPEAIVDSVEESDLSRAASKCLASVLYWRITNEVEIPLPSRPRDGQLLIELNIAQALSDAIAKGAVTMVETDHIDAVYDELGAPMGSGAHPPRGTTTDPENFVPIAVAAE